MPLSGTWEHRFLKRPFIHVAITALLFPAARPHCLIEEPEALYPVLMFVSNGGKSTRGWTGGIAKPFTIHTVTSELYACWATLHSKFKWPPISSSP